MCSFQMHQMIIAALIMSELQSFSVSPSQKSFGSLTDLQIAKKWDKFGKKWHQIFLKNLHFQITWLVSSKLPLHKTHLELELIPFLIIFSCVGIMSFNTFHTVIFVLGKQFRFQMEFQKAFSFLSSELEGGSLRLEARWKALFTEKMPLSSKSQMISSFDFERVLGMLRI